MEALAMVKFTSFKLGGCRFKNLQASEQQVGVARKLANKRSDLAGAETLTLNTESTLVFCLNLTDLIGPTGVRKKQHPYLTWLASGRISNLNDRPFWVRRYWMGWN